MRNIVVGIAVAAVVLVAAGAFAFNVPGAPSEVNKATSMATEMGLEKAASDIVKKYDCRFSSDATTNQTTCKNGKTFEQMVDELRGVVTAGSFTDKKVELKAEVEGTPDTRSDRRTYVSNQLEKIQKWYRISVNDRQGSNNRIEVSANAY